MNGSYWHLEYDSDLDNSHKYYDIYISSDGLVITRYGRKGFAAQTKEAVVPDPHQVAAKQVQAKVRKGYVIVSSGTLPLAGSKAVASDLIAACRSAIDRDARSAAALSTLSQISMEAGRLIDSLSGSQDLALILERWSALDGMWKDASIEFEQTRALIEKTQRLVEERMSS